MHIHIFIKKVLFICMNILLFFKSKIPQMISFFRDSNVFIYFCPILESISKSCCLETFV